MIRKVIICLTKGLAYHWNIKEKICKFYRIGPKSLRIMTDIWSQSYQLHFLILPVKLECMWCDVYTKYTNYAKTKRLIAKNRHIFISIKLKFGEIGSCTFLRISVRTVFLNLFSSQHPCQQNQWAASLNANVSLQVNEVEIWWHPWRYLMGTIVCLGTPVENHRSNGIKKRSSFKK